MFQWGRGNDEDYNMLRVQPAQAARSANDPTSVVDRARNLFDDNPRFEFEGLLASTHNGTTMRFKEVGEGGRRFVAKAGTSGTEDAVNNEISYLNVSICGTAYSPRCLFANITADPAICDARSKATCH